MSANRSDKLVCIRAENHAVDRLEYKCIVMNIYDLHERIAILGGRIVKVALLCGGKRMVSVADGE